MKLYCGGMSTNGRKLYDAYDKVHQNEANSYRIAYKCELLANSFYVEELIKNLKRFKNLYKLQEWALEKVNGDTHGWKFNEDKADNYNDIMTYIGMDVSKSAIIEVIDMCHMYVDSVIKSAIRECKESNVKSVQYLHTICEQERIKYDARQNHIIRMEEEKKKTDEAIKKEKNIRSVFESIDIMNNWEKLISESENQVDWDSIEKK